MLLNVGRDTFGQVDFWSFNLFVPLLAGADDPLLDLANAREILVDFLLIGLAQAIFQIGRLLRDEIGTAPAAQTQALHKRLLAV